MHRLDDNLLVVAQQHGSQYSTLFQESPLTAVVPKVERATKLCNKAHKGKRGTAISHLYLNRWLDDAAMQQGAKRVSCQVMVGVGVTGIDVSPTGSRIFDGDWALGTLSRTRFS